MDFKKYTAEFIGTLFLTHIGCGALVMYNSSAGWLAVALTFGLVLMAMTYCFAHVSGCHINPAVSLGMLISGKIDFKDFIGYIIAQFTGAIVGIAILLVLFNNDTGLGANGYGDLSSWSLSWWQALIAEIVLTAIFVMVMLIMTSKKNRYVRGIVTGLTFAALYLFGLPLTNASLNPA
ncbi:MAG: MIP/aquaporin family protein, partial [Bacillota bacterium]